MINKVISADDVEELNELIVQYNKEGWNVIHFSTSVDAIALGKRIKYYALLENKKLEWK